VRRAFRHLNSYVDRELSQEELKRVEEHLAVCTACLKEFKFQQEIIDAVRANVQRIKAPEGLRGKVLDALRQERQETGEN